MIAIQILCEKDGKTSILLPNGSADPQKIVLAVKKAAGINPKMGSHEENAKAAEIILGAASKQETIEINGVKFMFSAKERAEKTKKAPVKLPEIKVVTPQAPPSEPLVTAETARPPVESEPMVVKPLQPTDCIACQGSGKNSKGHKCDPCHGTGKKQITATGTVGQMVGEKLDKAAVVASGPATSLPTTVVPELLKCGICHTSLLNGIADTVETKEHGTVHRSCLTKMVRVHMEANAEERRLHHEAFMRSRIGELDRLFEQAVAKEVAKKKLGAAATVEIPQPYTSPKGSEECFLCQRRLNADARGTISSPVQPNGEKVYVHHHCLTHAVETDPSRNVIVTYEAWGLRLQPQEVESILQMHASIQESIADLIRAKIKESPVQVKVLHTEAPEQPAVTVAVPPKELEPLPSAAMLGLAGHFKASAERVYDRFREMGLMAPATTVAVKQTTVEEDLAEIAASLKK